MGKEKKSRRARGTGSVFRNRRGGWTARKPLGRTTAGKTLYLERSGRTQAEALRKLAAALPPGPDATVAQWVPRWLASSAIRPSSLRDYRHTAAAYILPTLGHLRVCDVTPHRVEEAALAWARTLGPNTLRKNLGHLGAMLAAAVRAGLAPANPAALARKPKGKRVAISVFTPPELALVIDEATRDPFALPFALLAAVGCRIGEAVALDVPDFDPAAGTVSVSRTYCPRHGPRPPKSERGVRTVRVPADALPALAAAAGRRTSGPLFLGADGGRRSPGGARMSWKALLRRLGLPYRNLHQLRHSVATAQISAGVPLGDVAKYLGDTVETVVKTYLHPSGADPADAMERLFAAARVAEK